MSIPTMPFEAEAYIQDAEDVAAYLAAAMETGDLAFLKKSLGVIAQSEGLVAVADRARVSPHELRSRLTAGEPDLSTVMKLLSTIGVRLEATLAPDGEEEAA